jgi:hypothetical protein
VANIAGRWTGAARGHTERIYDIFEKMSGGSMLWRVIPGHEAALRKLQETAAQSPSESLLRHLAPDTLIATINAPGNEDGKYNGPASERTLLDGARHI